MTDSMQLVDTFIPMDRRRALARGVTLPDRAHGAVLFADISGFTPLTEMLAQDLGVRQGAEELTVHLNTVYEAIVAAVDRHGGSVITFSGDALTCWFNATDEGLRMKDDGSALSLSPSSERYPSSVRAVACALAMQRAMAAFTQRRTSSGRMIALAMKAAVAAGAVRRMVVGDPQVRLMDTLAGATLARMAAGEHHAQRGEVVVSAEVVTQLGEQLTIAEWRADEETHERFAVVQGLSNRTPVQTTAAQPEPLALTVIRPWLLQPVYERLQSGPSELLAELRPTLALFLRFGGLDYDADEAAPQKLDAYIRWVQSVVAHYEGALVNLTIGDKGSYLFISFGAPIAHEDDAERALSETALALRETPAEFAGLTAPQIGICRGTMWTGAYGGLSHRTYSAFSDEVNLAARSG